MKHRARASFYGRSDELGELARLLAEPEAVVSLTGPPGSGKSRLAGEYADQATSSFAGGVHWVELADARSVEDICAAVAEALGEQLASGVGRDELVKRLSYAISARGEALFVLDDLEHIADAVSSTIDVWRGEADGAAFLVTTRERLRLPGERCIEVGPLPVPGEEERSSEAIARFAAVGLFLDRARAVRARWAPGDEEMLDVAALVRALDGIPLAIELCAARAALLGTRQILDRLPKILDLLAHGARGAAARQATVRGAIDCSWELLEPAERNAFALCAVFRGGFTLDAAERVFDGPAMDRLQALVDKSLIVVYEPEGLPGELRFRMYEPLARYAGEQLERSGDGAFAEARHAAWFAETGSAWAAAVDEHGGGAVLRRLTAETANLFAALERTLRDPVAPAHGERALQLVLALEPVLRSRGPLGELTRLLEDALGRVGSSGAPPNLVARALLARGLAGYIQGDGAASASDFEAAAGSAAAAGATELEALARVHLGVVCASTGKRAAARRELDAAEALAQRAGSARVEALVRTHRARWLRARMGRVDEARRELEAALATALRSGGPRDESRVHAYLGHVCVERGDLSEAQVRYHRACGLLRELGDRRLQAELLIGIAVVEAELGVHAQAHATLLEARRILEVIGVDVYLGLIELYLGMLALEEDRPLQAADHWGRASSLLGAQRYAGLVAMAVAGRALADARRGQAADAKPRMAEARALAKEASDGIAQTVELLGWAVELSSGQGDARARAEEALRAADSQRPAFGEPWQEEVRVHRFARRTLAAACAAAGPSPTGSSSRSRRRAAVWLVQDDGRAFRQPDGVPVALHRRGTLSRLLRALAERHAAAPGEAVGVHDLVEAGWPGERLGTEAAVNRVRVSLTALRKLGLRELLVTRDDGYLLDPRARVEIVADLNHLRS